jgi:hypothetical protein
MTTAGTPATSRSGAADALPLGTAGSISPMRDAMLTVGLLDPRWSMADPATPAPLGGAAQDAYVLPAGYWWVGPYAGYGTVQGEWKGPDAEALDRAEQWRSSWQAGLMAGRGWRNGFSVGGGVGIARVRSTFLHESAGPATEATAVDTVWQEATYPGNTTVHTWFVDSTTTVTPGPVTRTDARNRYTVLQVPVSVWWHTTMRRWTFGAMAGGIGWFPLQREGTTLLNSGADGTATASLGDGRVDRRFGMQLHGLAGVSLGYTLTEHLTLFAEPQLSVPLVGGDGRTAPALTRPTFQIRLQHELRSRR